ncbi:MAG: SDR family oxidoreductase [Steroidobacteraceae bacterium]
MNNSIERKRVFVTGASSGLGAAVAIAFAKQGADVAINHLPGEEEAAREVANRCQAFSVEALLLQGDVSRDESCRQMACAIEKWQGLHALINNAAVTRHVPDHGDLEALTAADFQDIYAVNVIGPFQMIRSMRPHLEAAARKCGVSSAIVNVSSLAGISGGGSSLAYAASKGALNTLTRSLAPVLAPLIRVNAICPAVMNTTWFEKAFGADSAEAIMAAARRLSILGEVMRPEDVAEIVLFLSGDSARYIIGELVPIGAGIGLSKSDAYKEALSQALAKSQHSIR